MFFLIAFSKLFSQVEFSPKDATWNYAFVLVPAWGGVFTYLNEQIVYSKDTIIGSDSIKILTHRLYYNSCYNANPSTIKKTLIKQKGDTVFFNNPRTQNTWQILYNFGTTPGSGWLTTMLKADNTPITYTFVVDSVRQISLNGYTLRRLYLNHAGTITERYGSSGFLFNFYSYSQGCDGYYFSDFLCYSDKAFGQVKFGEKSCNFSGSIDPKGIGEEKIDKVFQISPTTVSESFKVNFLNNQYLNNKLIIRDGFGREIIVLVDVKDGDLVHIQNFPQGIYYIEIQNTDGRSVQKIIKE